MSTNGHLSHHSPDIADDYDVGNDDDGEWNHSEAMNMMMTNNE